MSMTVKQLIEALKKENQNALVVLAKDGEGNSYSPLHQAVETSYRAVKPWYGEITEGKPSKKDGTVAAVVLWPTLKPEPYMSMTDYCRLLDRLREQRARPAWRPEEDRALLEEADAIFETLSEADQEAARLQSPRAFPDSSLVENVDPDRDMGRLITPRRWSFPDRPTP